MQSLLVVLMSCKAGRDEPFNDWYTNVHIRAVMRLPGSVAVQRFRQETTRPGETGAPRYLALYEIADRKACIDGHLERLYTPKMPISAEADFSDIQPAFFDLIDTWGGPAAANGVDGPVMIARLNLKTDDQTALEGVLSSMCSAVASAATLKGAQLFREGDEQLGPGRLTHHYLALFRVNDSEIAVDALKAFRATEAETSAPIDWANAIIASYAPMFPRLTAREVINPTPDAAAAETRARVAVGDGLAGNPRGRIGA